MDRGPVMSRSHSRTRTSYALFIAASVCVCRFQYWGPADRQAACFRPRRARDASESGCCCSCCCCCGCC